MAQARVPVRIYLRGCRGDISTLHIVPVERVKVTEYRGLRYPWPVRAAAQRITDGIAVEEGAWLLVYGDCRVSRRYGIHYIAVLRAKSGARLDRDDVHVAAENGELVAYYERHLRGDRDDFKRLEDEAVKLGLAISKSKPLENYAAVALILAWGGRLEPPGQHAKTPAGEQHQSQRSSEQPAEQQEQHRAEEQRNEERKSRDVFDSLLEALDRALEAARQQQPSKQPQQQAEEQQLEQSSEEAEETAAQQPPAEAQREQQPSQQPQQQQQSATATVDLKRGLIELPDGTILVRFWLVKFQKTSEYAVQQVERNGRNSKEIEEIRRINAEVASLLSSLRRRVNEELARISKVVTLESVFGKSAGMWLALDADAVEAVRKLYDKALWELRSDPRYKRLPRDIQQKLEHGYRFYATQWWLPLEEAISLLQQLKTSIEAAKLEKEQKLQQLKRKKAKKELQRIEELIAKLKAIEKRLEELAQLTQQKPTAA